jgi:hypothetical protein
VSHLRLLPLYRKTQVLTPIRLMQRALSVLPAGVKAYSSAIFEEDVTKKINDIAKAKSISKRMAKKHALKEIINSTDQGMIVADIVALSGCVTELEIHCDNCKDARGCKMLRPEIAHTLPQDAMPACGECWGKRGVMCTFKRMSPELEQQLRTFASFRTEHTSHAIDVGTKGSDATIARIPAKDVTTPESLANARHASVTMNPETTLSAL